MSDYKLVVIDSIWSSIDHSETTQHYLHKIFLTKKVGYGFRHNANFFPVGLEDMTANHILICKMHKGEYQPVCISKVALYSELDRYGIADPMTNYMQGGFSTLQIQHISDLITHEKQGTGNIAYSGGFTINRNLLQKESELTILKEIYCCAHALLLEDRNVSSVFGFAIPRLKTDLFFDQWGFKPICMDGKALQGYSPHFQNEQIIPIQGKANKQTQYVIEKIEKYGELWEQREDNQSPT